MAFNTPFQMPTLNQNANGAYRPEGSQIGYVDNATALGNQFGWNDPRTQGMQTRDVLRYQNGLTLGNMNTGFNGLGGQMSEGFNGLKDTLDYGGIFGQTQNRRYSPTSGNNGTPFQTGSF